MVRSEEEDLDCPDGGGGGIAFGVVPMGDGLRRSTFFLFESALSFIRLRPACDGFDCWLMLCVFAGLYVSFASRCNLLCVENCSDELRVYWV